MKKKHAIRGIKRLIVPAAHDDVEEPLENMEETGCDNGNVNDKSDDSEAESEMEGDGGTGRLVLPSRLNTDDHPSVDALIECPNEIINEVVEDSDEVNMEENANNDSVFSNRGVRVWLSFFHSHESQRQG